ncbi:hypothetical protein OR590_005856 [Pseudomonas aeruginosa]|nr:hypothetical protein [Pseudomonas aeruginosa]EKD5500128.1 hypothetical protein [Pseudomonas aeruginosa]EKD5528900.1 hypothetical protein [Pseudomonas aeruginosa]EKD5565966.1 hypothetical protein [Pseudomonas aeruginosa]EKD5597744.1 hypothetical protein [Pseudomonas aeruginosa]
MKLTTTAYYNEIDPSGDAVHSRIHGGSMNTRRTAICLGSLFGGLLYLFILAAGPIWGGIITAEATHLSAAGR